MEGGRTENPWEPDVGEYGTGARVEFHAWQADPRSHSRTSGGREDFGAGRFEGAATTPRGLTFGRATGECVFADPFLDAELAGSGNGSTGQGIRYDTCSWTGPWHSLGFDAREVVVSFNALTPGRSWIEVQIQVVTRPRTDATDEAPSPDGPVGAGAGTGPTAGRPAEPDAGGRWFIMARWCQNLPTQGGAIHRASADGQADDDASVSTDTLSVAPERAITAYRLRVTLLRPRGADETATVSLLGAVASRPPADRSPATSEPGPGTGMELPVRPRSQMVYRGRYPQWGGGGESWCSPTSVAMVMDFHHALPSAGELAGSGVEDETGDGVVPFSTRACWDHRYQGAGNWAFCTAYAACHGLEGFVTRLTGLRQAEELIAAGIPLVASVGFDDGELDGAGYSTAGHLLVISGFTEEGDVVVDDPAGHELPHDDQVRTVYRRDQFETVWLARSGGTVYVIAPLRAPLPPGPATGI